MKLFSNISQYKRISAALLFYIFWLAGFTFYSFIEEKKSLYQAIDQKLIEATRIAPLLLSKNLHHKNINQNDLTKEQDRLNIERLSIYTDQNDIAYIYTLVLKNNKIFFTSSSATLEERKTEKGWSRFLDVYDDVDPRVYDIFKHKKTTFIEYSDQWGTFRSAFIPLPAKDGSYYISVADVAIDHIDTQLTLHLYQTLTIAALFLLFAYPIYYTATKKIKGLASTLAQKVRSQTIELSNNTERLQLAMTISEQSWFDLDLLSGEMSVNDEYAQLLGYSPDTFDSSLTEWQNSIHPDDKDAVLRTFQENLINKSPKAMEYRRKSKDGSWLWIHSVGQVVEWDKHGEPRRVIGIHANITDRKRSEQVLRALTESGSTIKEDIFQHIVKELATSHNVSHVFIGCLDENNTDSITTLVTWANGKFADNFSYSIIDTPCQLVIQQNFVFYPDNLQQLFPNDLMLVEMEAISYLGVPLKNNNNEVLGLLGMLDNKPMSKDMYKIDLLGSLATRLAIELERKKSDKQLKLSSQVFNSAHEGIIITDVSGIIVDVNPAFCEITHYSYNEVIGKKPDLLSSGKHPPEFFIEMWKTLNDQGSWRGELWNRKKNGELYAELLSISTLKNDEGTPQNYIGLFSDITQSKEQQKALELIAHYDVLTGLPNRSLFANHYKHAITHSNHTNTLLAVCFLDLDEFKPVNDTYGHSIGDKLLIKVAHRIKSQLREEDSISRIGGDEFALLIGDIASQSQCEYMLKRLHDSLTDVFLVDGHSINISVSTGITLYPHDNADLDTLLRHADQAMYKAKLAGRNQYRLFDFKEDQELINKQHRLQEIKKALAQSEMHLYYQPKVNIKTKKVFGMEALIRWQHPKKGLISPLDFLPIINGTEIEIQLGEWVIKTALQQLDTWHSKGLDVEVSVNVSYYHLQSPYFINMLHDALDQHVNVNSKYLQLEILESSALGDLNTVSEIIHACQNQLGIYIALDDFGTGYSSLAHLRNLSANTLKIDQSFVKNILSDADDYAIIDNVICLAVAFNRDVIAEGVESIEHGAMLMLMGCERVQGYIIAKPMPASDVFNWVKNYQPNPQWMKYNLQEHSPTQNKVMLFQLCLDHWYESFLNNIESTPDTVKNWPEMRQRKCHHAIRLKQMKREQLFNDNLQQKIDETYQSFHLTSQALFNQYTQGDVRGAVAGVDKLRVLYQELNEHLQQKSVINPNNYSI